ncbi:MAG: ATP-dependent DNA helicase RecG [Planctomycetia bacterium]|nr:ATP-dependent DNA helicase RecG [Planctomycetia bacterium]
MSDLSSRSSLPNSVAQVEDILRQPITLLNWIKPVFIEPLWRLGIYRVFDLLFFFPRDYQDCRLRHWNELEEDVLQSVMGTIKDYKIRQTRVGTLLSLTINVEGKSVQAVWFNQVFYYRQFWVGRRLIMTGKPKQQVSGFWQMTHPKLLFLPEGENGGYFNDFGALNKTEENAQNEQTDFNYCSNFNAHSNFSDRINVNEITKGKLKEISNSSRENNEDENHIVLNQAKETSQFDAKTQLSDNSLTDNSLSDSNCQSNLNERLKRSTNSDPFSLTQQTFLPIYPLTEGITQVQLQRIIRRALQEYADYLPEVFPESYLQRHHLLPVNEAIRNIHFPSTEEKRDSGRRRFVYQELLILQLALAIRRQQHQINLKAPILERTAKIDSRIRALIPFDLTEVQNKVIEDISVDLAKPVPMNRLLQGDVGSGKTIVAIYAMLQAVANGYQAVFMAPTEVLARQHLRTLERLLAGKKVQIASLFGGQKAKERAAILQNIMTGTAQIIVGTQAIICNEIEFHQLGLVVIDEQHKFGVRQRAALKTGTKFDPHYLVMTATPIPRSLTMTLFGDLEVSLMKGFPPGRQKISTSIAKQSQKSIWWDFFRKKLQQGRQGYVVVSRVDETEQEELRSVQTVYDELSKGELADFRLGMIHGRMTTEEKESMMLDFRTGEIQVLISTSVIEVGVDVPNATLMTIENAERFGLAQLHQLRGRIGRGKYPGFCCIFMTEISEKTEMSNEKQTETRNGQTSQQTLPDDRLSKKKSGKKRRKQSESEEENAKRLQRKQEESFERLQFFVKTTDGFELAEKDFELRGPGELFGTQQHGLPPFRIAHLVRDYEILVESKKDASQLVQKDPGLAQEEHQKLRKQVLTRYGKVLELGDVG